MFGFQRFCIGLLILGSFWLMPKTSWAQLNADFTANTTQGCSPVLVNFQNQSSGNITDYSWRFGTGGTSDSANPSASYVNSGKYTVTLIVENGNNADSITKTNYITVFENPSVDFKANPQSGCRPLTVNFTDQTQQGDAPISTRNWDFGDGGSSSSVNPQHTYKQSGNFKVSLFVRDQNGCTDIQEKQNFINVSKKPKAKFSSQRHTGCEAPLTVYFSNLSTGKSPLSYEWQFGNGNTASNETPKNRYNDTGEYDVTLIVTDANGCKDTLTKEDFVKIQDFERKMSLNKNKGCINPTTDTFQFQDLSTPTPSFRKWDFGDGTLSSSDNPSKLYARKGVYEVKLINGLSGCLDTLRDTIRVQQIEGDFKADSLFSCKLPFEVNFSDQSTNAASTQWYFDSVGSSNQENPSVTFNKEDSFEITMVATNAIGCKDTAPRKHVVTELPDARLNIIPPNRKVCRGVPFEFSDSGKTKGSTVYPETVKSREWFFGDGDSTSSVSSVKHTYPDTGEYKVRFRFETINGCKDSAKRTVFVGDTPSFKMTIPDTQFCASEKVQFDTFTDFADSVVYNYDNGRVGIDEPEYSYDDTGWFHPFATAYHNGCPSEKTYLSDSFYILPPVAKFNSSVTCDSPLWRTFVDFSIGSQRYYWDLGNGDTSTDSLPVKKFPQKGRYKVKLKVFNDTNQCVDSIIKPQTIYKPEARFTMSDSVGCQPITDVKFDASASEDAQPLGYSWNFKNGNIIDRTVYQDSSKLIQPPAQDFVEGRDYDVSLVVADPNFCRDTMIRTVDILAHKTHIAADPKGGCIPFSTTLEDTTQSDTTIVNRSWDLGDGTTVSGQKQVNNTYNQVGDYTVSLKTKDESGCQDSTEFKIKVGNPDVYFTAGKTEACRNKPIEFIPNTTPAPDSLELIWKFGNGDTAMSSKPKYRYPKNGEYDVKLIGIDNGACADSVTRQDFLNISAPIANFDIVDTGDQCPPLFAKFKDSSKGSNLRYNWKFGDGSGSLLSDPQNTYTQPGTYPVSLSLEDNAGCVDTLRDTVALSGPTAKFSIDPDSGCKPLEYRFYAYDKEGGASITWDLGDGNSKKGDTVTHHYESGGYHKPTMIVNNKSDTAECEYGVPTRDTVPVDTLEPIIDKGKADYCEYEDIQIKDASKGTLTDWAWATRDPQRIDSGRNPDFSFDSLRKYHLTLTVVNYRGCQESTSDSFTIHPKPEVNATGAGFICEGQELQLQATEDSDFEYEWMPGQGVEEPDISNPLVSPDTTTNYRAKVETPFGCKDTSDPLQVLVQRRPNLSAFPDTTIIKGDSVELQSSVETEVQGYTWRPLDSLNCDTCTSTYVRPSKETVYALTVEDTSGCFEETDQARIKIDRKFKIVLPEAFTPNGDGTNDKIFVEGWGIKELITFEVYNRWGEVIYKSDKLNEGWDGYYKGEVQNTGTYSYYVKARSFEGEIAEKKGKFNLLH